MRISDWSSDVCSSDLRLGTFRQIRDAVFDRVVGEQLGVQRVRHAVAVRRAGRILRIAEQMVLIERRAVDLGGGEIHFAGLYVRVTQLGDLLVGRRRVVVATDRKSTRLNSSHSCASRMPSSA